MTLRDFLDPVYTQKKTDEEVRTTLDEQISLAAIAKATYQMSEFQALSIIMPIIVLPASPPPKVEEKEKEA